MFKNYPYWGWLLVCILLWGATGDRVYRETQSMKPVNMAAAIQADLNEQERSFEKLLADKELVKRIFDERLTHNDVEKLNNLPFKLFAYQKDILTYWNTNDILVDCGYSFNDSAISILHNDNGIYIKKCIAPYYLDWQKKLTILFPVEVAYPFENKYLRSHFIAADNIPLDTRILSKSVIGSYEVNTLDRKTSFHLLFPKIGLPSYSPDGVMILLLISAVLATIVWFHLMTIYLTRKRSRWVGLGVTAVIILGVRILTYKYGMPFNLDSLTLFSPQLYASNAILKSLGDLLLNTLCLLWIVIFIIRHIPYNFFEGIRLHYALRLASALILMAGLYLYAFAYINVTSSVVLDSMISFDVSHFYSINSFTIIGLFTIGMFTGLSCLIIYLVNVQLNDLLHNKWIKYLLLAAIGIPLMLMSEKELTGEFSYMLLTWLLLFIILLDVKLLTDISNLFSPSMIFWSLYVCIFSSIVLQYFNEKKELETRKRYAEQILQQKDDLLEAYTFRNIQQKIQKDRFIRQFMQSPSLDKRKAINERFDAQYLNGQLNEYQCKVLFFDEYGHGLYNSDTSSYSMLSKQIYKAMPTITPHLYYKEYAQDGHYYIADIPIAEDSTALRNIGYVFIDIAVKESAGESVYPELLKPGTVRGRLSEAGYSYGVYVNRKLITHTNDNPLPLYYNENLKQTYTIRKYESSSELWYTADGNKVVVVIHYHKEWLEVITLFSYMFGINVLILLLIVTFRWFLSRFSRPRVMNKLVNLTLRRRIHFSMLGIVLVSFSVIGVVTVAFFTIQYKQNTRNKLQLVMQVVEKSIIQYLNDENGLTNAKTFNEVTNTSRFKYLVTNLASTQKVDINVYNGSGTLNVTSQENIYDKALLAPVMRPDAFYLLNYQVRSMVVQNENIGTLSYLSCYVPIRDENGNTFGYINVPFFASEKELNFQISNILVALINLYAFIFLFSGVMTVFITNWLTRTLSVVIKRFERLNLKENELIEWPYDDEIGLLVREYNKMVKKLEYNAHLLAQSEREGAWREMAKQVAHEIKNPLTPMKLNIQYLQQALRNNYPNIEQLAQKVSESLIEQIDNLSYIASEFSNFAKMPEAKPENIDLDELLERAAELYLSKQDIKVTLAEHDKDLVVYADKSQLLRVFTNLLENAVQAIPVGRDGIINIAVEKKDSFITISIEDNGIGIKQNMIDKIFQPYFTTKTSGTGLGLAMTKKIIEFWKGAIWFTTRENEGTTFYIKLPLVKQ